MANDNGKCIRMKPETLIKSERFGSVFVDRSEAPGVSCVGNPNICTGGSVCINGVCLCPDGLEDQNGFCVPLTAPGTYCLFVFSFGIKFCSWAWRSLSRRRNRMHRKLHLRQRILCLSWRRADSQRYVHQCGHTGRSRGAVRSRHHHLQWQFLLHRQCLQVH